VNEFNALQAIPSLAIAHFFDARAERIDAPGPDIDAFFHAALTPRALSFGTARAVRDVGLDHYPGPERVEHPRFGWEPVHREERQRRPT
jgi:hypothetical protein